MTEDVPELTVADMEASQRNVGLVERLTAEGRMRPAGLAEVARAKADGRWAAAYAGPASIQVPSDLAAALDAHPAAQALFEVLSGQNRYALLHRITTAKRPETPGASYRAVRGHARPGRDDLSPEAPATWLMVGDPAAQVPREHLLEFGQGAERALLPVADALHGGGAQERSSVTGRRSLKLVSCRISNVIDHVLTFSAHRGATAARNRAVVPAAYEVACTSATWIGASA